MRIRRPQGSGVRPQKGASGQAPNTLTDTERAAGWKLLFDGKTTTGWRAYGADTMPSGWQAVDGILSEIDLRAAFREKLGREIRPYVILGACNPPLAFKAITADPSVGLLLPCNVTVESLSDRLAGVRLTDPEALLASVVLDGAPEVRSVARDARARMLRVAETLSKAAAP